VEGCAILSYQPNTISHGIEASVYEFKTAIPLDDGPQLTRMEAIVGDIPQQAHDGGSQAAQLSSRAKSCDRLEQISDQQQEQGQVVGEKGA
jgi:hypothetical protein